MYLQQRRSFAGHRQRELDHWDLPNLVMKNDVKKVTKLLKKYSNDTLYNRKHLVEQTQTTTGWNPISLACQYGHTTILLLLIHHVGGIANVTNFVEVVLSVGCYYGQSDTVKSLLLLEGVPHNVAHQLNATKLFTRLLQKRNVPSSVLLTPFAIACYQRHVETAQILLQYGSTITIPQSLDLHATMESSSSTKKNCHHHKNNTNTPLGLACQLGLVDIVDRLLQRHVETDQVMIQYGSTTINVPHNVDLHSTMDTSSSTKNCTTTNNTTPLGLACQLGLEDVVHMLLRDGAASADYSVDECNETTPLYWACTKEHEDIVDLLIEIGGANVNRAHSQTGETQLFVECRRGNAKMVQTLLRHGASIDCTYQPPSTTAEDEPIQTPLYIASVNGHNDIVILLLAELGIGSFLPLYKSKKRSRKVVDSTTIEDSPNESRK